jgi:FkbM family methyltransferase
MNPSASQPLDSLFRLLNPRRLTAVVDIGANPVDGDPPYKSMLAGQLCAVLGFEPQTAALESLKLRQGPQETYLPHAIGDGSAQTLHVCTAPGMSSLLKPDANSLALFPLFPEFGNVISSEPVETRRLDDIAEIEALDFLKIDVQGSELSIFRSGRQKLAAAVVIQTEVSFVPLYERQPTIGDIDNELRGQGFIPHAFYDLKRWIIEPMRINNEPRRPLNQLLEADLVYVRDFRQPIRLDDEQLKHLALIAHYCYRSYDLALYCIRALEDRGGVAQNAMASYIGSLQP